mmetsp:Transcript_10474/g.28657  ORF Transcript_10474/g.28657 Transcript_10474/m.28657 type:complete len:95 (+) Transcript_10474:469-753(+)
MVPFKQQSALVASLQHGTQMLSSTRLTPGAGLAWLRCCMLSLKHTPEPWKPRVNHMALWQETIFSTTWLSSMAGNSLAGKLLINLEQHPVGASA